jgi:CRP/FNR family transcriptional regulator
MVREKDLRPFELIRGSASESNPAFHAPDELAVAIGAISHSVVVSEGGSIFQQGDPARGVYLVRSGRVRATLFSPQGKLLIDRLLGPGALMGVPAAMCARRFQFNADALETCELGYVEAGVLNEFLGSRPELCVELVQMMSRELIRLRQSRDYMHDCGHPECSLYDACNQCSF